MSSMFTDAIEWKAKNNKSTKEAAEKFRLNAKSLADAIWRHSKVNKKIKRTPKSKRAHKFIDLTPRVQMPEKTNFQVAVILTTADNLKNVLGNL